MPHSMSAPFRHRSIALLLGAVLFLFTACAGEQGPLEIIGVYSDGYSIHTITDAGWEMDFGSGLSLFHVLSYDNISDTLVAHNDTANTFNPGLYSRFDWLYSGGALYYCQSAYAAASEQEALAASADAGDLAAGCGGFSWSLLTPQ